MNFSITQNSALWTIVVVLSIFVLRLILKQYITSAIKLEADKQLEKMRSEIASKIESIRHEYQLNQLKTSLMFDHKRSSFAKLLSRIAEVNREWLKSSDEPDLGITGPLPKHIYQKLFETYYEEQLFLDSDCLAAMDLILNVLGKAVEIDDKIDFQDCKNAFFELEYLQSRVAEIFQEKIGLISGSRGKEELALLGAILLLNRYHFREIQLPIEGPLEIAPQDSPADLVAKAEANKEELLRKLNEFRNFLHEGHGFFYEAETQISRYLKLIQA